MKLVVGITGATGAIIGIELLRALRTLEVETHLVMSQWARTTIEMETDFAIREVRDLASFHYGPKDQAAAISSGSFQTDGMVVAPCSMKTLAGIRNGYGEGLITRAADVTLKERRRLVLVPREAPLSEIHLENMLALARMGAVIAPPVPAFYHRPRSVAELVSLTVARLLDQFGLELPDTRRWQGLPANRAAQIEEQQ